MLAAAPLSIACFTSRWSESGEISAVMGGILLSDESNVEEAAALGRRHGRPPLPAEIAVHPDVTAPLTPCRKTRENQGDVPGLRNHRVVTVGTTLLRPAGVDVNVCDNRETPRLADRPEVTEVAPVEADDAAVERMRVEVVVEH